jgi:hypothetical protein
MPNNTTRAIRARTALTDNYDSLEVELVDMLTDLMHMCQADGINFVGCLMVAETHFLAEKIAEGGSDQQQPWESLWKRV